MRRLELIVGPMFSGKSEELIRRLKRASIAGKKILILKPETDKRTDEEIAARGKDPDKNEFEVKIKLPAVNLRSKEEGLFLVKTSKCEVVGVDEIQFFPEWFFDFVREIIETKDGKNLTIILSGLDMDAWGRPFGIVPQLLAIADSVQKVTALCFVCGREAQITQKIGGTEETVEVGDADIYEARCRMCFASPKN